MSKLIKQHMVFALVFQDRLRLAVVHDKLFASDFPNPLPICINWINHRDFVFFAEKNREGAYSDYFVMRDSSLATDNVADNFEQIWMAYSKDTIRRIL